MTPADAWVPVPLRWRHVRAGDMFVDREGQPWFVADIRERDGQLRVETLLRGGGWTGEVDPDDVIPVLVPVLERDMVELTREQLGARLVERR